jgi:hypothetical protein
MTPPAGTSGLSSCSPGSRCPTTISAGLLIVLGKAQNAGGVAEGDLARARELAIGAAATAGEYGCASLSVRAENALARV